VFGISMWEVVLILVVALIVLGPRQLTEVARTLGKMYREIQKLATDVRNSVDIDALTSLDDRPEPPRPKYEPPPPVKNPDLLQPSGERSGPDFYADLLESSKESEEEATETAAAEEATGKDSGSAAAQAREGDGEAKKEGRKEETPKEEKHS
jgi:Sec-independent protein translocase protein TatA